MKMFHNEKNSDFLLNVDEDLLKNAYMIDDAEKLKQYIKTKNAKPKKPFYLNPMFRRCTVIAACLLIVIGISLPVALPMINSGGIPLEDGQQSNKTSEADNKSVFFDSLDKVNYYAGLKSVTDANSILAVQNSVNDEYTVQLLNASKSKKSRFKPANNEECAVQPLNTSESEESCSESENDNGYKKTFIVLDDLSDTSFRVLTAVYFKLEVTEKDGLLASRIGTGDVSVIMTDLYIGYDPFAMITFKNGDQYFSCLTESYGLEKGENWFETHLYIKGFKLYKDTTECVSSFKVVLDPEMNRITSVSWIPYNKVPSEAPVYPIKIVPESTQVSNEVYEFTLRQLAEYYSGILGDCGESGDTLNPTPDPVTDYASPSWSGPWDPWNYFHNLPIPEQTVTVRTETDSVIPSTYFLWSECYDKSEKGAGIEAVNDAYDFLTSGKAEIPSIKLSEKVDIEIAGEGELQKNTRVYYKDENNEYFLKSDFNGSIDSFNNLTDGEWYVIFSVVWHDDYVIYGETYYRSYCNEYLFKLVK